MNSHVPGRTLVLVFSTLVLSCSAGSPITEADIIGCWEMEGSKVTDDRIEFYPAGKFRQVIIANNSEEMTSEGSWFIRSGELSRYLFVNNIRINYHSCLETNLACSFSSSKQDSWDAFQASDWAVDLEDSGFFGKGTLPVNSELGVRFKKLKSGTPCFD